MRPDLNYVVSRNTLVSNIAVWLGVASAIILLSVPWWGTSGLMRWAVEVMCYLVLAQMWNLMAGYGGLMSVGIQAFVGIGAYSIFVFAQHMGLHPFLSIPLGGVVAALAAGLTSIVVFRMRGGYFAIGTWVLAEVFRIAFSNVSLLGGGSGQSLTVMTHIDRSTRETGIYLDRRRNPDPRLRRLKPSAAVPLRPRPDGAAGQRGCGGEPGRGCEALKLQVYMLASFGAGLVGAIYFTNILRVSPSAAFDPNWAVAAIFIVVIGGIGTIEGPIVGTAIFFGLRWLLADYGTWYWLVMGAVAVVVIVFAPTGVWGFVRSRWDLQLLPLQRRLIIASKATSVS